MDREAWRAAIHGVAKSRTRLSKEPACNARDLGSVPGLGRSPAGGHGNPLQYSCLENLMDRGAWGAIVKSLNGASLVAQTIKCLPAMQETWVQSLGQEDPQEKEMATHSSIFAWRILWTEESGRLQSIASQRVRYD